MNLVEIYILVLSQHNVLNLAMIKSTRMKLSPYEWVQVPGKKFRPYAKLRSYKRGESGLNRGRQDYLT
jgi:hypothetical protein